MASLFPSQKSIDYAAKAATGIDAFLTTVQESFTEHEFKSLVFSRITVSFQLSPHAGATCTIECWCSDIPGGSDERCFDYRSPKDLPYLFQQIEWWKESLIKNYQPLLKSKTLFN